MDSVFFKIVDFLVVVNELDKRGLLEQKPVYDTLVLSAVGHYNREFAPRPQQSQTTEEQSDQVKDMEHEIQNEHKDSPHASKNKEE